MDSSTLSESCRLQPLAGCQGMERDLEAAIEIALQPGSEAAIKQKAIAYCDQIKTSTEGWKLCLLLFTKSPRRPENARFFALQTIEDVLKERYRTLDDESTQSIRYGIWNYIYDEYNQNARASNHIPEEQFIRNKLSFIVVLLMKRLYLQHWTSFFTDLFSLTSFSDDKSSNNAGIDFTLRVLQALEEDIADQSIARTNEDHIQNNITKDAIRERNMGDLSGFLQYLIINNLNSDFTMRSLDTLSNYVVWIDINLIVKRSFLDVIYAYLPQQKFTAGACSVLKQIVEKKMNDQEKFDLLQFLGLNSVLTQYDLMSSDFINEDMGDLIDANVVELLNILFNRNLEKSNLVKVEQMLSPMYPWLLRFLGHEYDDVSETVFRCMNALMKMMRREGKDLYSERRAILLPLLKTILSKFRYDEDDEWQAEEEDIDEEDFAHVRAELRIFENSIATINTDLYIENVSSFILQGIQRLASSGSRTDWRDVEVIMNQILWFYEPFKGQAQFLKDGEDMRIIAYDRIISEMLKSDIGSFPHPSAQLLFFEIVTKNNTYFDAHPESISPMIELFLSPRALDHTNLKVRYRSWYLFYRFVAYLQKSIDIISEQLINTLRKYLVVEVELSEIGVDQKASSEQSDSVFINQLYLFEATAILISQPSVNEAQQRVWTAAIVSDLCSDLESILQSDSEKAPYYIHHDIQAIGNFAKGFPNFNRKEAVEKPWMEVFIKSTSIIFVAFMQFHSNLAVRDAAQYCLGRFNNILGPMIIPILPQFIDLLLSDNSVHELSDFITKFLGQLVYDLKAELSPILQKLLIPFFNRIFVFLNQPIEGTDDAVQKEELTKAYIGFISVLFQNSLQDVFLTTENIGNLETVLQSLLHYTRETNNASVEKMTFSILNKMVVLWTHSVFTPIQTNGNSPAGFDDKYIYSFISPLCFEVPTKTSTNRQSSTKQVWNEIATLQKSLFLKKGDEYIMHLSNIYFPSAGLPVSKSNEYTQALIQLDSKKFSNFFNQFMRSLS